MPGREKELEEQARISLEAARHTELSRRKSILTPEDPNFKKLLDSNPHVAESLGLIPPDWRISYRDYGLSFLRDYPYETALYDIRGWDACRLVVDLDLDNQAVAMRLHALDGDANITVEEGILVRSGEIVAINDGRFDIPHGPFAMSMWLRIQQATGNIKEPETLRFLFDYFKDDIGQLPNVKEICGETFGRFATSAHFGFKSGELALGQMRELAVGWPMIDGGYLRDTETNLSPSIPTT